MLIADAVSKKISEYTKSAMEKGNKPIIIAKCGYKIFNANFFINSSKFKRNAYALRLKPIF